VAHLGQSGQSAQIALSLIPSWAGGQPTLLPECVLCPPGLPLLLDSATFTRQRSHLVPLTASGIGDFLCQMMLSRHIQPAACIARAKRSGMPQRSSKGAALECPPWPAERVFYPPSRVEPPPRPQPWSLLRVSPMFTQSTPSSRSTRQASRKQASRSSRYSSGVDSKPRPRSSTP
jgi:hypothetical protein